MKKPNILYGFIGIKESFTLDKSKSLPINDVLLSAKIGDRFVVTCVAEIRETGHDLNGLNDDVSLSLEEILCIKNIE
jgi:hypothetical protein